MLAALPTSSSAVFVWAAAARELQKLDTDFRVGLSQPSNRPDAAWVSPQSPAALATLQPNQPTTDQAQEVTMVAWSRSSPTLAAGTSKGNLQLFQLQRRRRTPVVGKHTKRVLCGAWGAEGLLAMGAADKTVRRFP
jgi:WD repeat-containing protein 19